MSNVDEVPCSGLNDEKVKEEKEVSRTKKELTCICDRRNRMTLAHYFWMGLWTGWFGFYFYLPITWTILWYYCKPLLGLLVALILASQFYPLKRKLQPEWGYRLGKKLTEVAADYFHLQIHCEDYKAVNESGQAIWSIEPHDVLPCGIFSMSDFLGYFPGHRIICCLTGAIFKVPIMRHIFTWARSASVDKKYLQRLLDEGLSIIICPGGALEVTFMTAEPVCNMYLKKRQGLVKLAMQYGVPIIPTITYHGNDAYNFYVFKNATAQKWGRKMGFVPLIILGIFNIPFAQPKSMPLQVIVGCPIPIPKVEGKPTDEQIQHYHDIFVEATRKLYEDHREQFGINMSLNIR